MTTAERICLVLDVILMNPGIPFDHLARATQCDPRTLERHLEALVQSGFVEVDQGEADIGERLRLILDHRRTAS